MKRNYLSISFLSLLLLGFTSLMAQQLPEIEMVFVEGGPYTMGCTFEQGAECSSAEIPAHVVPVGDFYIGKYEVTQALWKAVMGNNPSSDKGENKPVEYVNYYDAIAFIGKLNTMTGKHYRLPTEAEWEYAARGGKLTQRTLYSGSNNLDEVANYHDNSNRDLKEVGSKKPNELGIYDMSGNVREWCSDHPEPYELNEDAEISDSKNPSDSPLRILRGGCVTSYPEKCRVSSRDASLETMHLDYVGFRLILDKE